MDWKAGWTTLRQTAKEFIDDNALRLSAALAYYSVFSLAPLLIITMAVAGALLGEEAARGQLDDELRKGLGASGAFARKGSPAGFGTFRMMIRADGTIARTPAIRVA